MSDELRYVPLARMIAKMRHYKDTTPPPKPRRNAHHEVERGEPIVERVLAATVEVMARAGYRALRVEDVALVAGVNKTTVYRRWPEKVALVRDALESVKPVTFVAPETGSLRGDLRAMGLAIAKESCSSPLRSSIIRMLVAEGADPEVADIKRWLRSKHEATPLAIIAAAVARGEIEPDFDASVVFDAFIGAIHHKLFFMAEPIADAYIDRLVDMIASGVVKPRRERSTNKH